MLNDETIGLRPATSDDLAQILLIENQSYPNNPWTQQAFEQELSKPFAHFYVLTDNETDSIIYAYLVYWKMFDEVHLLNLAVNPEYRGLGFAKRLLRFLKSDAIKSQAKRIFLEVRKSNQAAVTLYQQQLFFIDHTKKNFYQNGEDAYFMVLYLDKSNEF